MPHRNDHRARAAATLGALLLALCGPALPATARAQQLDEGTVIRMVDSAVQSRVEHVLAFTDTEHYRVFRGKDATHPAAEMTALDTYSKGTGKQYTILSQSGSGIVQKFGLRPLIASEETINRPGLVEQSWFTSANYEMKLNSGSLEQVNGRDCYALSIRPRHPAPNLIVGKLWVDARDGSIVQVEGVASRSPSPFAGTTHMMRQYVLVDGFPMAVHARAESSSFLFGRTVIEIEYSDYKLQTQR